MIRRPLGRSGLTFSEFGLGTMAFGPGVGLMAGVSADAPVALRLIDLAAERGVTWIDTADVYQKGHAETIVGRWLRRPGNRHRLALATKVGGPTGPGPGHAGLSPRHIEAACHASLRRLGVERIDLYQVHWPDVDTPLERTLEALTRLRDGGKIRAVGCSNFPAWLLGKALWASDARDLIRFEANQLQYNLLLRHIEREVVPLCLDQRVGILPWSPLAGGLLCDKHRTTAVDHPRLAMWRRRYGSEKNVKFQRVLEKVREVSRAHDCSPSAVALRWLADRPAVTGCILGVRTERQLLDNLQAADLTLAPDETGALDRASAMPPDYPTDQMNRLLGGGPFWD